MKILKIRDRTAESSMIVQYRILAAYFERQRQRVQPDQASTSSPAGGYSADAGSRETKARQPRVSSREATNNGIVQGGRKSLPAEVDRLCPSRLYVARIRGLIQNLGAMIHS